MSISGFLSQAIDGMDYDEMTAALDARSPLCLGLAMRAPPSAGGAIMEKARSFSSPLNSRW